MSVRTAFMLSLGFLCLGLGYGDDETGGLFKRTNVVTVYRVNCGSDKTYVDTNKNEWAADQELAEGNDWGAVGGGMVARAVQTIPGTPSPEVYRTERYGAERYEFKAEEGVYCVRLHFAETYQGVTGPGKRVFDFSVNSKTVKGFDPFKEACGFSRPAVKRLSGIKPENGKITVNLNKGIINGIEIFKYTEIPDENVKRILFIGNSFTQFWDLPGTVEKLVNTGAQGITIETDESIMPGRKLKDHWKRGEARNMIMKGNYDYVVLQEYSQWTGESYDESLKFARFFSKVAEEAGAKTLLYCTWSSARPAEVSAKGQKRITEGNYRVAKEINAQVVPAGPAWQAAKEQDKDLGIQLYADKTGHPTLYSAYLTACVFYSFLTGDSPEGHPVAVIGKQCHPIEPEIARFLQKTAAETVRQHTE